MTKSGVLFWIAAAFSLCVTFCVTYVVYEAIQAAIALMTFLSLLVTWSTYG